MTELHVRFRALALACSLLAACGGSARSGSVLSSRPEAHSEPAPRGHLVRQPADPRDLPGSIHTRARGVTRAAGGDGSHLWVADPTTGVALAREWAPDARDASVAPDLTTVCVAIREWRGGAPSELGAFDLVRRVWRWRERIVEEGGAGTIVRVLAGTDACAAVVRTSDGDRLELRALQDGAPRASDIPLLESMPSTTALWSDDLATVFVVRPATAGPEDVPGLLVDVRDGRTLAQRVTLWARCIEVDAAGTRITLEDRVEPEARRAWLGATVPDLLGECTPPPPPPAPRPSEIPPLPSPWMPITADVVAVHDERGLHLWDHRHRASPRQLSAEPVVRFEDIDRRSRPLPLVVPPDAAWIGFVREDGTLARLSLPDGAPLSEVVLPRHRRGEQPTADDAEWQVFAGARDRLLVTRGAEGHRRAYVGDPSGNWRITPAPIFPMIEQAAEHEDAARSWLVSDPHFGPSRVDEVTGALLASFSASDTLSRHTTAVRSPDGAEIFVGVTPDEVDDAGGLYFLDARTLEIRRRFEARPLLRGPTADIVWTPEGVVFSRPRGFVTESEWARIDPSTGAGEIIARGPMSISRSPARRGATHLIHSLHGGVLISGSDRSRARWLELVEGGAVIEEEDGRVWCEGAGCDRHRCVIGANEVRPASDPACREERVH